MIREAAFVLWSAAWWRLRGTARTEAWLVLPGGGQAARAICAALMAAPTTLMDWRLAGLLGLALFAGMVAAGWGEAMDIGRTGGTRLTDALAMTGWGLVAIGPAAAVLWWWGAAWWPLAIAGAAFGPIYAAAWWLGETGRLPAVPRLAAGPTEWAELGAGAAIGRALAGM